MLTKSDEIEFWLQKFRHVNHMEMEILNTRGDIRRLPKLGKTIKTVCAACQSSKQIRAPHERVQQIFTTYVLEFVYMDLFRPT
jgi:hypothetical protein